MIYNIYMRLIVLPLIFALLGYITSTDAWILFLNKLTPFKGLLIYYLVIFIVITLLQYFGLVIGGRQMKSIKQTIGEIMILFAFFIIFNFESEYIQWVVDNKNGKVKQSSNCTGVYLQAEDGAVYYIVNNIVHNPNISRIITFIIAPFILCLIGMMLIEDKILLSII